MTSWEWAAFVQIVAMAIAQNRTSDEILFLSLLYTQLGDVLAVIATTPPEGF